MSDSEIRFRARAEADTNGYIDRAERKAFVKDALFGRTITAEELETAARAIFGQADELWANESQPIRDAHTKWARAAFAAIGCTIEK